MNGQKTESVQHPFCTYSGSGVKQGAPHYYDTFISQNSAQGYSFTTLMYNDIPHYHNDMIVAINASMYC